MLGRPLYGVVGQVREMFWHVPGGIGVCVGREVSELWLEGWLEGWLVMERVL